mgnify:CR=1 FL=1
MSALAFTKMQGLGNDFVDYLTPGVFTVDPGLPGLAQVFFVFASGEGVESATGRSMGLVCVEQPAEADVGRRHLDEK